ncbi:protein artemis-like [Aricia agestis]|uniref:protein artemis-like n=1 Tax=Aricia agestis TaxID=91739 RepID=UPI001C206D0D|nr:protein artemis-like [Aricia agestis]
MNNTNWKTKSSFNGIIHEIPGVVVDNFENPVQKRARAFFLSHCHLDHIQGLFSLELFNYLKEFEVFIYTTELNAAIINNEKKYDFMEFIKVLPKGSTLITLPSLRNTQEEFVTVTLVPAGHCAGSTMFLFKTKTYTILFTGDFRININDISKYKAFHENYEVIKIDTLYIDTTFLEAWYENFPKRSESVEKLIYEIRKWLSDKNNAVALHTSAKYGYEYVFNEIHKVLGMKVYVGDRWQLYSKIPHLVSGVTNNENITRIHLCTKRYPTAHNSCINRAYQRFLYVNLSAMKWVNYKSDFTSVSWLAKDRLDVCFATHCSKNELISFTNHLMPNKIIGFPNPWKVEKRKITGNEGHGDFKKMKLGS